MFQASQFPKNAVGGLVDTFIGSDETSIERPFASPWIHLPASDEQFELVVVESEDDTVYGNPNFGMLAVITCHDMLLISEVVAAE